LGVTPTSRHFSLNPTIPNFMGRRALVASHRPNRTFNSTPTGSGTVSPRLTSPLSPCWRIKDVSTYNPQAYGPTPFSPRDSQGSCQSAEQEDYKRLIYLYSLTTQTLTMIRLENNYTTLERTIKPTRYERDTCPWVYDTWTRNRFKHDNRSNLSGVVTTVSPFPSPRTVTTRRYSWLDLWWTQRIEWIQGSIGPLLPFTTW
jgi:hypothetical protein